MFVVTYLDLFGSRHCWVMGAMSHPQHPIPVSGKSSLHGTFKQSGSAQKSLETRLPVATKYFEYSSKVQ